MHVHQERVPDIEKVIDLFSTETKDLVLPRTLSINMLT